MATNDSGTLINGDSWLSPRRFALLLGILIAALFPDILFAGKSFMFRDFGIFTYPNAFYQREIFWKGGGIPLWNPLNNTGIPFLAQWNTMCLYPLSLVYLLLPLGCGLSYFMLIHLFIAGLGMYFLASRWTGNRLAGGMAGVAFCFNGMTLNALMWTSHIVVLAWMPWVIMLVEQAWLKGDRRSLIWACLVSAMQMLAGVPELILFTWLILLAMWIGGVVRADAGLRWQLVWRASLVVLTTTLLVSAQLLPFFDLFLHSERTTASGSNFWSIPSTGWANFFIPLFHCYKAPLGVYFQHSQDVTSSYYVGVATLVLALIALLTRRSFQIWLLSAFALFGFVAALGDAGRLYPALMKAFPLLGFMRYPVKFVYLTTFCLPLMGAFAVAQFRAPDLQAGRPKKVVVWMAGSIAGVIIIGLLVYSRLHPFPFEDYSTVLANGLLRILLLALVVGTLSVGVKVKELKHLVIVGLLLLVFLWVDFVTHAPRQNPTVDASVFTPGLMAQRMNQLPKPGAARAMMTKESHDLIYGSMLPDAFKDQIGRRCALFGDCNLLDGIPVADGFYSLYVRQQRSLFVQFFIQPTNVFAEGFADFLGITEISDSEKVLGWQFRHSALPICSAGAKPEFVALSNTPALLLAKEFDPRQTVYLPIEAIELNNATNAVPATVQTKCFSAQKQEFTVQSQAPTWLVLSQTFYHPWRAYVNGQPTPIWRANYAFQAIPVPQGNSDVTLVYRDRAFLVGLWISLLTMSCCLLLLIWRRRP